MATRKKYISWRDFTGGLNENHGFRTDERGVLEVMDNAEIDYRGRIVPRPALLSGPDNTGATRGLITKMATFSAIEAGLAAGAVASPRTRHFMFTISAHDACLQVNEESYAISSASVKNYSTSTSGVDVEAYWHEQLYAPFLAFDERVFFGLGAGGNRHMSWGDATGLVLSTARVYNVGASAPTTPASVSVTDAAGSIGGDSNNDLEASKWYGVTYTYYNSTYGVETAPATVVAAQTDASNKTLNFTLTYSVDAQWDKIIYYITDSHDTEAAAEATTVYKKAAALDANNTYSINNDTAGTTDAVWVTGTEYHDPGGAGSTLSYTLGAANDTLDHDQLTELPNFLATSKNVVYAAISPNTVRFSKVTADGVFPDWFPAENSVTVGGSHSRLTALEAHPTQDGILAFTQHSCYHIIGTHIGDIEVREVPSAVGCGFPRTMMAYNGTLMFMGTDSQIYETNGQSFVVRSKAVERRLRQHDLGDMWFVHAGRHQDKYVVSVGNTHLDGPVGTLTDAAAGANVVFGAADTERTHTAGTSWDLSSYVKGTYVESDGLFGYAQNWGIISAVDDGSDVITSSWAVEDTGAAGTATSLHYGLVHDTLLVYYRDTDHWTSFSDFSANAMLGTIGVNQDANTQITGPSFLVAPGDAAGVGARSLTWSALATLEAPTSTRDTDQTFTLTVAPPPHRFDELTQFTGVKIIQGLGAGADGMSCTVKVYVDDETTASITPSAYEPSKANNYTVGFMGQGHSAQVEVTITHSGSITEFGKITMIQLEYEAYH